MASDLIIKNNENSLANLLSFLRNQCLKLHKNTRLAHDQLLRVTQKKTLLWKFQFKFEVFDEYFLKLHHKWNKNYNVNMLTGKKTGIWFSLARSDFRKENCSYHVKTNYWIILTKLGSSPSTDQ